MTPQNAGRVLRGGECIGQFEIAPWSGRIRNLPDSVPRPSAPGSPGHPVEAAFPQNRLGPLAPTRTPMRGREVGRQHRVPPPIRL